MGFLPENQVRTRLPAGGNRIRTIGPAPAKGSSGRCQSETAHQRRSHLQVQVRSGNACLEWLPIAFPFAEGPRVRIRLPPAESPSLSRSCREPRLSARLCAAGLVTGSAETRRVFHDRANRRQYLCRAIFQYRSAADGVGENATPVPIKSGRSPSLIVQWISALGPGSTKAQHDPLIVPGKRQA